MLDFSSNPTKLALTCCLFAFMLVGCGQAVDGTPTITAAVTNTLIPSPTKTPTEVSATATTIPAVWQELQPGLEMRRLEINAKALLAIRVDLAQLVLKVHYDPQDPKTVAEWQAVTNALVVVNAGFFEPDDTTSGLLILDGVSVGESFDPNEPYLEHSGMLTVRGEQGGIYMLSNCPPQNCTQAEQAVQGLPVLIHDAQPVDFALPERAARRTVAALDAAGNLLLIIAYEEIMTLPELRDGFLETDLELESALNLDGGPSSGMLVKIGRYNVVIDSVSEVPSVIALYAR